MDGDEGVDGYERMDGYEHVDRYGYERGLTVSIFPVPAINGTKRKSAFAILCLPLRELRVSGNST